MTNFEELLSLANLAGLEARIICPSPSDTSTARFGIGSGGGGSFSICVAAPPCDNGERYRPFNARSGGAHETLGRNVSLLREAARALAPDGLMFVYGLPCHLARYAAALCGEMSLRYW